MTDFGYQISIHLYECIMKDNHNLFYLSSNGEVLFDVNNIEIDIAEALTTTFFNSYKYTFLIFGTDKGSFCARKYRNTTFYS